MFRSMTTLLLATLTIQRLMELVIAKRNTRQLFARGAYEVGASHYPLMIALHASWLVTLWWFGYDRALWLPFVSVFALLQLGRAWVLGTLGRRWTTRVLIVPAAVPITASRST